MKNRRLMIRLIDVALIILLGFIAISRLKTEYVNLPSGSNSQVTTKRPHEAILHIYRNYYGLMRPYYISIAIIMFCKIRVVKRNCKIYKSWKS